jgi:hypothetical protein
MSSFLFNEIKGREGGIFTRYPHCDGTRTYCTYVPYVLCVLYCRFRYRQDILCPCNLSVPSVADVGV